MTTSPLESSLQCRTNSKVEDKESQFQQWSAEVVKLFFDKPIISTENGNSESSLISKNTPYYKATDSLEGLEGLPTAKRLKHFHMN